MPTLLRTALNTLDQTCVDEGYKRWCAMPGKAERIKQLNDAFISAQVGTVPAFRNRWGMKREFYETVKTLEEWYHLGHVFGWTEDEVLLPVKPLPLYLRTKVIENCADPNRFSRFIYRKDAEDFIEEAERRGWLSKPDTVGVAQAVLNTKTLAPEILQRLYERKLLPLSKFATSRHVSADIIADIMEQSVTSAGAASALKQALGNRHAPFTRDQYTLILDRIRSIEVDTYEEVGSQRMAEAVALRDDLDDEFLVGMIADYYDLIAGAPLERKDLSETLVQAYLTHHATSTEYVDLLTTLAEHRSFTTGHAELLKHSHYRVRRGVGRSQHLPAKLQVKIALDSQAPVRVGLAYRKDLTKEACELLASDRAGNPRWVLAQNTYVPIRYRLHAVKNKQHAETVVRVLYTTRSRDMEEFVESEYPDVAGMPDLFREKALVAVVLSDSKKFQKVMREKRKSLR